MSSLEKAGETQSKPHTASSEPDGSPTSAQSPLSLSLAEIERRRIQLLGADFSIGLQVRRQVKTLHFSCILFFVWGNGLQVNCV